MKIRSTGTRSQAAPAATRPDAAGQPEEHVGYLLKRLQHSIRQAIDERLRHEGVGLSFAHIATLFVISHHPGTSGARIAKATMVTAQTTNTILRRLETEGSVERRPHPENRRVDCWYITDGGRARMLAARAAGDPVWNRMLTPLSDAEVGQLRGLLKRCIAGLEQSPADVPDYCLPAPSTPRSRPRQRPKP